MKVVYKHQLMDGHSIVPLPLGAKMLSVTNQENSVVLYALVDPEERVHTRYECVVLNTGEFWSDLDTYTFIGTVNLFAGMIIKHVFIKYGR